MWCSVKCPGPKCSVLSFMNGQKRWVSDVVEPEWAFTAVWDEKHPKRILSGYCPLCGAELGFLEDGTPYSIPREQTPPKAVHMRKLDHRGPDDESE